jgi:translocation and assembly module TamA
LFLALTLATAAALPPSADAQSSPPAPPGAATLRHADDAIRYRVEVVAPAAIAATFASAIDLIRWQDYGEMTEDLFDRLARDAVPQAKEAAATQGYFSATVEITVDRATQPVTVKLVVTPNLPTHIANVGIDVAGPANDAPEGKAAIAKLRDEWLLPKGAIFRQETWTAAKEFAVATLAASPYAAAKLTASEARIDPPTYSADLDVSIASGPPFRVGEVVVQGLKKYTPELVQYATVHTGDLTANALYHTPAARLLRPISRACSVDRFRSRAGRRRQGHAERTRSAASPRIRRRLLTDTQYQPAHRTATWLSTGTGCSSYQPPHRTKVQQLDARLVRPPAPGGRIDTYAVGLQRTDIVDLVTRTAAITARRRAIDERRTPEFGIGFYVNEQTPAGFPTESSHALYVDGEYTWRNVDSLLDPKKGWMANVQLGVGPPGVSTEKFGRVIGKAIAWWPFSRSDDLSLRAEAGAVIAQSRVGIPSTFLFRTGGDTTVRGYAFESLGVKQGSATVGGRYYAVASAEVVHWIDAQWGIAAFVDAGNATDTPSQLDPVLGYGVGARLRTPIGPFRLDLAYGQEEKSVRVHFSVGLSF